MRRKVLNRSACFVLVVLAAAGAANAGVSSSPKDVTVVSFAGDAQPGKVKVGQVIHFTVSVKAAMKYELSVGTPDGSAPLSPSQPLKNEVGGPNVWAPHAGKLQKLTFGVTVASPPGATGTGMWCMSIMIAPSFNSKSPAPWAKMQSICYRASAKGKASPGA